MFSIFKASSTNIRSVLITLMPLTEIATGLLSLMIDLKEKSFQLSSEEMSSGFRRIGSKESVTQPNSGQAVLKTYFILNTLFNRTSCTVLHLFLFCFSMLTISSTIG